MSLSPFRRFLYCDRDNCCWDTPCGIQPPPPNSQETAGSFSLISADSRLLLGFPASVSTSDLQSEVGEVLGEIGGELPAKFEGDFRASFAGENRQKHFPPKLRRKLHRQTSLRGSGLWRALHLGVQPKDSKLCLLNAVFFFQIPGQGPWPGTDELFTRGRRECLKTRMSNGIFVLRRQKEKCARCTPVNEIGKYQHSLNSLS